MNHPRIRPGLVPVVLAAGLWGAVLAAVFLALWSLVEGVLPWQPLNGTSHFFNGPEAGLVTAVDLRHTLIGTIIHFAGAFWWAGVAWVLWRLFPALSAGVVAVVTVLLAVILDYGLLPPRFTPGWEHALSWAGVAAGFVGLGLGLWVGLALVGRRGAVPEPVARPVPPRRMAVHETPAPPTALDRMRLSPDGVLDQRQQRIDPTNAVTHDPNAENTSPDPAGDSR